MRFATDSNSLWSAIETAVAVALVAQTAVESCFVVHHETLLVNLG